MCVLILAYICVYSRGIKSSHVRTDIGLHAPHLTYGHPSGPIVQVSRGKSAGMYGRKSPFKRPQNRPTVTSESPLQRDSQKNIGTYFPPHLFLFCFDFFLSSLLISIEGLTALQGVLLLHLPRTETLNIQMQLSH